MPFKFETNKLKIPRNLNRNVKLSLSDRALICVLYKQGNTSQRKLAKEFKVSRRLITFILDPKKEEENKQRGILNRLRYYTKEKHKEYMKQHRKYKQKLSKLNKLKG